MLPRVARNAANVSASPGGEGRGEGGRMPFSLFTLGQSHLSRMNLNSILPVLLFFALPFHCFSDEASAARKIFADKQECVVWLSAVAKISYSTDGARDSAINIPDREQRTESLGTIIDPSGLVVTA